MPLNALIQFVFLVLVVSAYLALARRNRVLRRPLAVAIAVTLIGVIVSVLGAFHRGGWAAVLPMARRSLVGSAWWGALIGAAVWLACRFSRRRR